MLTKKNKLTDTKKKPRSMTSKVGTRTALVYTGAAILIVVVGLRTLLQMTDEGFGFVEFITIGALGIEFAVLLLYAYTIYSSSKEEEVKESFKVKTHDMPEVAMQLRHMSETISAEVAQLREQNRILQTQYSNDMPEVAKNIQDMSTSVTAEIEELRKQNVNLEQQYSSLTDVTDKLKHFADGELDESYSNFIKFSDASADLLSQLASNENTIQKHSEEISKFTTSLNQLIDEQITLRIRQEIQHLLSTAVEANKR